MLTSKRFRLESGPFLMEVIGSESQWIARLDGAGEHFKLTCPDEVQAKMACLDTARKILDQKSMETPASLVDPKWM